MSELKAFLSFSCGDEEILRIEEKGPVCLKGREIGGDPTLYKRLLNWRGRKSGEKPPSPVHEGPGIITFWVADNEGPIVKIDLDGVHVKGELTEDFDRIIQAFETFLEEAEREDV